MSALWSPADLLAATGGLLRRPFSASGVSIDSRTVQPGALFVALATETGDGHDFVAAALARGAAGAMVHRLPDGVGDDAPLLQVGDTLAGLHALGGFSRARFGGRVVAVTGSVGKTTTKEMLRAILSAFGRTWAAEASHNNHWGVPLTLARLPPRHDFCVVEIGMNHAGEIAPLSRLAQPHVAAITSIAAAHIGHLGSIEAIAREKLSIAQGLVLSVAGSPGMVLPSDSRAREVWDAAATTFGTADSDAARLLDTHSDSGSNRVLARVAGEEVTFTLHAPGAHMAMNATCALAVAASLGLDMPRAAAALDGFAPVTGRGARRSVAVRGGAAILLDESYNASAVSVRAALSVLALQPAARKIAVLGDMLELGEHAASEHASLAPDVERDADVLFTCGRSMRLLHEAVRPALRGEHTDNAAALAPIVAGALRADDAVLVKGSLGSRMKLVVQAIEAAG